MLFTWNSLGRIIACTYTLLQSTIKWPWIYKLCIIIVKLLCTCISLIVGLAIGYLVHRYMLLLNQTCKPVITLEHWVIEMSQAWELKLTRISADRSASSQLLIRSPTESVDILISWLNIQIPVFINGNQMSICTSTFYRIHIKCIFEMLRIIHVYVYM